MAKVSYCESHRRSITKSLIWRFIGIFWTWGGAYVIIMLLPDEKKTAFNIASLVTLWHHSTRMIMYYAYERIWSGVNWGKHEKCKVVDPMTPKQKIIWSVGITVCVFIVMWLLMSITPLVKENQKDFIESSTQQSQELDK